jgi:hypothetical protein
MKVSNYNDLAVELPLALNQCGRRNLTTWVSCRHNMSLVNTFFIPLF